MASETIPCPRCGRDLFYTGALDHVGWVLASHDPDGKVRLDLVLSCDTCAVQLNAFVAFEDFQVIE